MASTNPTTRNNIMASTNPREINFLAKKIDNLDQKIWNEVSEKVMFEGVYAKFSQNDQAQVLLNSPHPHITKLGV